jgi:hypothetical protein
MSSRYVLFEGRRLKRRSIGRVFRRGSTVVAELDGLTKVLRDYDSVADAEIGKRYLLVKLNRRRTWI